MQFNKEQYIKDLNSGITQYCAAVRNLESVILSAPIEQAIELKNLRTPGRILRLEIDALRAAGFDMDKKSMYGSIEEYDCIVLAYTAAENHCKKFWPHLLPKYDMTKYRINGE